MCKFILLLLLGTLRNNRKPIDGSEVCPVEVYPYNLSNNNDILFMRFLVNIILFLRLTVVCIDKNNGKVKYIYV